MRTCPRCEADLSPWEGAACVSCRSRLPSGRLTNSVAALRVLEREPTPLGVYDIARAVARDIGRSVPVPSMQVALSQDPRFCWAGKGLYGLYRHRLFPGPRTLGTQGAFLLASHGGPVHGDRLAFAMKYLGYRFQDQSLKIALAAEPFVEREWSGTFWVPQREEVGRYFLQVGFAPGANDLKDMMSRAAAFVSQGLVEYEDRLRT